MPELSIKQWRAVIKKMPREKKEILALSVLKIRKKRNDPSTDPDSSVTSGRIGRWRKK